MSSQFGIVDTCGFPKDFFYYRAWWRPEPSLHLFPHLNWRGREGEEIPVWVYTNVDEVELFLNGKSLGTQKVPNLGHVEWKVPYEVGIIEARAMKDGRLVLSQKRETTGAATSLKLTADRNEINADGEDVAILKAGAFDKEGRPVPTAANTIVFGVSGPGKLIAVGNGNPNCQESDKEPKRSLFNGLAQAIIQSTTSAGEIRIEAAGEGRPDLPPTEIAIISRKVDLRAAVPVL